MAAALYEQDFLCRIFGNCIAGDLLDREVGTVIGQGIPGTPKLFTYARYNAELSADRPRRAGSARDESRVRAADGLRRAHRRDAASWDGPSRRRRSRPRISRAFQLKENEHATYNATML